MSDAVAAIEDGRVVLRASFAQRALCKEIPSAYWHRSKRAWVYPLSPVTVEDICRRFGEDCLVGELADYRRWVQSDIDIPDPAGKLRAWTHQREGFRRAYKRNGYMLAFDMGTGKTKVSIDLADAWDVKRMLIVCPKTVCAVWPGEFTKHSLRAWRVAVLDDGPVKRRTEHAKGALDAADVVPTAIVLNYEATIREPFRTWALAQQWDLVVYDESHHIKAPGGKQSWFAKDMRKSARRVLALSGTPMAHSPLDIYGQYRAVDPGVFGTSFTLFKARYAITNAYYKHQVVGYQNQMELNERFYSTAYRVPKRDAVDLPPTVHEERFFTLSLEERDAYNQMENDFYSWLKASGKEVTIQNALVKLLRLQQVTGGFVNTDDGSQVCLGTSKIDTLRELLCDIPQDEPIVVFCRFVADLGRVREAMECSGPFEKDRAIRKPRSVCEISGRAHEYRTWCEGRATALIAQIGAGSEGIDLTRSSYAVFYSVGFSLSQYQQALARLDRPGQTRSVTYHRLIANGTVDERVFQALEKREDVVEHILSLHRQREG